MSLATLMVRTVLVVTPGARVDAYGDPQPDWTSAIVFTTTGWLAQQSSLEVLDGRQATASTLSLTLPPDTPITARDRVRVDGILYEVSAEPLAAWTPRGEHHIEVQLSLVSG